MPPVPDPAAAGHPPAAAAVLAHPRPARAAVVRRLADLVQPGRDLHLGAAPVPADGLPGGAARLDRARADAGGAPAGRRPRSRRPPGGRRPAFGGWLPTWLLATLLVAALALRFGLNAFDSNVIDVGYAGVIGADRIAHGETPYGNMPSDCGTCDTYGPLTYVSYVPFELAQPWEGRWDSLPAAHGAATPLRRPLHRRHVRPRLVASPACASGIGLALAWSAFPFTAFALETNSNDSLVAAALIWGLVLFRHPARPGAAAGARAREQVRPGGAAAALEPPALPARRRRAARARRLRRRPGRRRRPHRLGAAARRPRRRDGVLVAHHRLPARPRLALLDLGPAPGAAPAPDRPDGARRRRGAGRAALAAAAGPADHGGALGGPHDRHRAHRDPLVLPLHPLVPALRPARDGPGLAAAPPPGRGHRPTRPARPSASPSRSRWPRDARGASCPGPSWPWQSSSGLVPLQFIGFYDQGGITDIPTYREAYDRISDGQVPYADFSLEYPPLAAGLFWLAGALPGQYEVGVLGADARLPLRDGPRRARPGADARPRPAPPARWPPARSPSARCCWATWWRRASTSPSRR